MKLHEFQSKRLFADQGIPVPPGRVASSPDEARRAAEDLGYPVVVKAQVLVGGRGKAGGIRLAKTPQDTEAAARDVLGMQIRGLPVRKVLVEAAAEIEQEFYLGVTVNRSTASPLLMASSQGGVDIEEVARVSPEAIKRVAIDPCTGLRSYHTLYLGRAVGLEPEHISEFGRLVRALYAAFWESDATLAEINPLVLTDEGDLVALDAKMVIDDNALYRHPELEPLRDTDEETPPEREAREAGISYIQLDGEVACMVNGAGLAMATMDLVKLWGGAPANFLDIGGGARADVVCRALRILLSSSNPKVVLINIFGGITRCDEVAAGLVQALTGSGKDVPVVARLVGTNEAEGRALLEASSLQVVVARDLADAARRAVAITRG